MTKKIVVHFIGSMVFSAGLALGGLYVTDWQWWVVFLGIMIIYFNA